jgi:hypothetical protein
MSRPRKLPDYRERVMLEEVRLGLQFSHKRIAARYGISTRLLEGYVSRARMEGRL